MVFLAFYLFCIFLTAEDALKSKSWRKQASLKIIFYIQNQVCGLNFDIEYLTEPYSTCILKQICTLDPFSWQQSRWNCEFSFFQADPACVAITWTKESFPLYPLRFLMSFKFSIPRKKSIQKLRFYLKAFLRAENVTTVRLLSFKWMSYIFSESFIFLMKVFLFSETLIFSSAAPPSPQPTMPSSVLTASLGEYSFISQCVGCL